MKRLRENVRHCTGRNRAGWDIREVIADLNPLLRRLGQLLPHRERRRQVRPSRRLRGAAALQLDDQEAAGTCTRPGSGVDGGVVGRARPVPAPPHDPLSEGSVTMSRRSPASRMRENRTYGLKGGWTNSSSVGSMEVAVAVARFRSAACLPQRRLLDQRDAGINQHNAPKGLRLYGEPRPCTGPGRRCAPACPLPRPAPR
jgi:hypothetical protein